MAGTVITFYSYKGGVGRSFAVANIAVILAQWGCRVLVVDWDIEAPGLTHYFSENVSQMAAGVLDFLDDCQRGKPRSWSAYAAQMTLPDGTEGVHLMPAAAGGGVDYTDRVQHLDWNALYEEYAFGTSLETLRAEWIDEFDFVLVDSRTGVTDFSGLTTAQLPDVLAFLFTANAQSLQGCSDIARRAMDARRRMPVDRPALLPLPIPGRFEQREEYDRAQAWRARFAEELAPFLDIWKPRETDSLKLIDLLTIPYVPRWSFGEDLVAVMEPAGSSGTRTPGQAASYALETIAALLVHGFAKVELLVSSRDEYVHAARAAVQDWRARAIKICISYAQDDRAVVREITAVLRNAGFETWLAEAVTLSKKFKSQTLRPVERSDAYIVVVGTSFSRVQEAEVESLLRQSLRTEQRKAIIPVLLPGGETALASSRLADFAAVQINPGKGSLEDQLAPVMSRLAETLPIFYDRERELAAEKFDPTTFIDRECEQELFEELLSLHTSARILAIRDKSGTGKSQLLEKFRHRCRTVKPRTPVSIVKLDQLPSRSPLDFIRIVVNDLSTFDSIMDFPNLKNADRWLVDRGIVKLRPSTTMIKNSF